ncbi:hypothetical protein [Demequina mangrovi]|uniref:Uncharacterized protein n=1 Tax=Demequina mangrovi TaxID=1043493 RepID=A0A1H6Z2Y0_9MICO|nr:hypothetical protein [Demequina mangrovi]SEJ46354.1 hypothetical protein SAMN05421637_1871 [Demequina mangrovi]
MRYLATAVLAAAVLAGCSTAAPEPSASPSAIAATCPETLVEPDPVEHGLGPFEEATGTPSLPEPEAAWWCTYSALDTATPDPDGGVAYGWRLQGEPATIAADDLAAVSDLLDGLEIPDPMRACTADLGPRHLLVLASGSARIGVAIDAFGCHDVRLTDDPWSVAPGETTDPDLVTGVLSPPDGMLAALNGLVAP